METVYAADKNVTVSMFPGFRDGAMDSSDASMSTSLFGRSYKYILSMAGQKFRRNQKNSADASANHRTEYPDIFRSTTCPSLP
jgi:hypothetical protein